MKLLIKLVVLVVVVGVAYAVREMHKHRARERLAAIDRGERCATCGSHSMAIEGSLARCDECGYECDLESMREEQLSGEELDAIFTPDKNGFWD